MSTSGQKDTSAECPIILQYEWLFEANIKQAAVFT
jgi:hypothetical protein